MRLAAILQVKQRARDRCNFVDSSSMSHLSMAREHVRTRPTSALCELINRKWLQWRSEEAYKAAGVMMRTAKEGRRLRMGIVNFGKTKFTMPMRRVIRLRCTPRQEVRKMGDRGKEEE